MLREVEERDGCSGGMACQSGSGVGVFLPMRHRVQREAVFYVGLGPSRQTLLQLVDSAPQEMA